MSYDGRSGQRFTDRQVSAILKRAVELQASRSDAAAPFDASAGVSLAQLQQAAAELGIEPRLIEEAALELTNTSQDQERASFWGGPSVVSAERIIHGTVSEEEWPLLLEEIRRATGLVGTATTVGNSFE
jgi:hypothetical protein